MEEFETRCKELMAVHGRVVSMECIHGWCDEIYADTSSPWELSGTYKIKCEDGAELVIISRFSFALCLGSFGVMSDSTNKLTNYDYARDDRVLAYLAAHGAELRRDKLGKCELPEETDAERILYDDLMVPFEALKYGSKTSLEKSKEWMKKWQTEGMLAQMDDGSWVLEDKLSSGDKEHIVKHSWKSANL